MATQHSLLLQVLMRVLEEDCRGQCSVLPLCKIYTFTGDAGDLLRGQCTLHDSCPTTTFRETSLTGESGAGRESGPCLHSHFQLVECHV